MNISKHQVSQGMVSLVKAKPHRPKSTVGAQETSDMSQLKSLPMLYFLLYCIKMISLQHLSRQENIALSDTVSPHATPLACQHIDYI